MARRKESAGRDDEATTQELLRLHAGRSVDLDFVRAEADELPLSAAAREHHARVRAQLGEHLHAELLFALTHQQYAADEARDHWAHILEHRRSLRGQLGREPGIAVAALDYLTNIAALVDRPTVIAESKILAVAEVATRNGMTGLYDHTSFFISLRKELRRHERYGDPVAVILLDVDHFKRYNDSHGHRAGDRVLGEIARVIAEEVRDVDLAARYGGEEFAVLAPATGPSAALQLAERLRIAVARELAAERITVSVGVGTCPEDGRSADPLIRATDEALYRAKRAGRDQTCSAGEPRSRGAAAPPDE